MAKAARRIMAAVIAAMPPERRVWGEAILAEIDHVPSARDRARLVLGATWLALLPSTAMGGYARVTLRAARTAAVAWIPLGAVLYLSNVAYPTRQDDTPTVLAAFVYLAVTLMAIGSAARRASARRAAPVLAGLAAGLVTAVLTMTAFALIDNIFLTVVSRQQGKIDGLRTSGMTSMRAYINASLEATAPGELLYFSAVGAVLAIIGARITRASASWAADTESAD